MLAYIPGFKHFHNNYASNSSGTAIYYRISSKAEQLHHSAEASLKLRSRITMAKIDNTWMGEFYAPVNSTKAEEREEFYAYAAEAIE